MKTRVGRLNFSKHLILVALLLEGDAGRGANPVIPFLSTPAFTTGRFSCTLQGESNATYIVLTSTNLSDWTPVATNRAADANRTVEFIPLSGRAFFKAQSPPISALRFALAAKGAIIFASPATIDSFNSADPTASTEGLYDPAKARGNGDIAANNQIVSAVAADGEVKVYGHLLAGWGGLVNFATNVAAGSMTWIDSGNSGIQPGWSAEDMNVRFEAVSVPFTEGNLTPAAGDYFGTNYAYLLGSHNYQTTTVNMSSLRTMMVIGNAQLYVTSSFNMSGQSRLIIAPGASLKLFVGGNVYFSGQGIFNQTGKATNFCLYGLPACNQVSVSANPAELIGVIYAPSADVGLGSYGVGEIDFKGAITAGNITAGCKCQLHYDESLAKTALAPPVLWISLQPADQTALAGSDVTFAVAATGTPPLNYQWWKGARIAHQTNSTLTLTSVQFHHAGAYWVEVANEAGSVMSRIAQLTVLGPPVIVGQPATQDAPVGMNVTLAVGVLGPLPVHYQWRKDGVALFDQTSASLTLTNVQPADQGAYSVVVSNAYGSVTSAVAQLTVSCSLSIQVDGPGTVSLDPDQTVFAPGSMVTLTATAGIDYEFSGWSGGAEGNQNPLTLAMDGNKSVTAHFLPKQSPGPPVRAIGP